MNIRFRLLDPLIAIFIFAICLLLYNATLTPSLSYASPDGNELTTVAAILGLAHPPGYPLLTWLGFLFSRLIPVGDAAHRTNLVSAFLGAGGVALLFLIARRVELPRAFAASHLSNLGFAPAFTLYVLLTDWRILKRPLTLIAAFIAFVLGAAQFAWIPLRAATITEPLLMRFPPNTLAGFYVYTLGAFTNLRFAFPLAAMPERIVIYVGYAVANLTPIGFVIGVLGAWALLFRHPKRFWLLIGMWLTNVWFFTQYKVFDLDVFFIPAHFVFAIFVGVGAHQLSDWLRAILARWRFPARAISFAATIAFVIFLAVPLASLAAINFRENNRATDTAIPDFYQHVYAILPRDSALVGRRAVFGFDMFYWQAVYRVRPDVTLPMPRNIPIPNRDAPIFTTVRVENGQPQGGIWSPPRDLLPTDAWYIPVLIGSARDLVLFRASATPPPLMIADAQPQSRANHDFGGLMLLGYDVREVESRPLSEIGFPKINPSSRVQIKTYWQMTQPRAYLISTRVDDRTLETHDLGFGNLARYAREARTSRENIIVEEFDLVIPSHLKRGAHPLKIGVTEFADKGITVEWVDAGTINVK
ncbi:MAG: DUF2723 domain-containing protein, partial [Chloroflexi bacterium]|nr:DUF2723 domain-containing protein [Chloroflexota bacterium]